MELQRESMEYDVVIVGAGPAGLATSIKLKQINPDLNVCILEKGSEVGAHILSGNVFETLFQIHCHLICCLLYTSDAADE